MKLPERHRPQGWAQKWQDGEVRSTCVRYELVRDVDHVVAGFLYDNCVKNSTSRCYNLGGVPTSWIPLQNRETILMMHEIAVCVVKVAEPNRFGQSVSYHRQDHRPGLGVWTTTSAWICTNGRVGSRQGGTCTPFVGS